MKIVYDNVDFSDSSKCGGMVIREYPTKWCVTILSNYMSSRTDVKATVPKADYPRLDFLVALINHDRWMLDEYLTNKGYIVQ